MGFVLMISTAPEREASQIGQALVTAGLAACVNIIRGVSSIFRWQGKLCREKEALLLIKTTSARSQKIINKIKEIHSYEVPEIIFFRVDGGEEKYLKWVNDLLKK